MTTVEENKLIARRWFALIAEAKVEEICEMITPNWIMHGGKPGLSPGPDGIRELFGSFGSIDQKWTVGYFCRGRQSRCARHQHLRTGEFHWHTQPWPSEDVYCYVHSLDC